MSNNKTRRTIASCMAASSIIMGALLWLEPEARACTPMASDWWVSRANVAADEASVPTDLRLRLELARWLSFTGGMGEIDPSFFEMICDGSSVEGTWSQIVFSGSDLAKTDKGWEKRWGCEGGCTGIMVTDQIEFIPDGELPELASCHVVLNDPVDAPAENPYPRTLFSFSTQASGSSGAFDLGEPASEATLYTYVYSACEFVGPYWGSCPECIQKLVETRWGVVFTYPDPISMPGDLLFRFYVAGSLQELESAEPTFVWLTDSQNLGSQVAMGLGQEGDGQRCFQVEISDRRGRTTPRSQPVCLDSQELDFHPSSGCSAVGKDEGGGISYLLLLLLAGALGISRMRLLSSAASARCCRPWR